MGVGGGSTAEVREAPGREKLALQPQGCARISSHPEERSGRFRSRLPSKPALRALFRQRWRGDPHLGPRRPAL